MDVLVVIPTYNEAENLSMMVSALLQLPFSDLHILVVDDNSPDQTGKIAEDLRDQTNGRVHVLHRPGKLGLGTAYISGFQYAIEQHAHHIVQMDADFSHPVEKVPQLINCLKEGFDVALGSRYIPGGALDKNWSFFRKMLSTFGNAYARTILNVPIRDVTGGFRAWKRETLAAMPLSQIKSNGYVFQVEMAFVANAMGFKLIEVPFYFSDRKLGVSKMSLKIQLEAAFRVWKLRGLHKGLHPRSR